MLPIEDPWLSVDIAVMKCRGPTLLSGCVRLARTRRSAIDAVIRAAIIGRSSCAAFRPDVLAA
jgi:hypothetical protein